MSPRWGSDFNEKSFSMMMPLLRSCEILKIKAMLIEYTCRKISSSHQCRSNVPTIVNRCTKYLGQFQLFLAIHFLKVFFVYLNMTKAQLKTEIQMALDNVPENVLQDVLDFLKALQHQPADKVRLANNLRQILSEDKELLQRLAK